MPKKAPTNRRPAAKKRRAPKQTPTKDRAEEVRENKFFKGIIDSVAELTGDAVVLLNIPVWGYPGHGKTTALLTAIH